MSDLSEVEHHNDVLARASKRAYELEDKLAAVIRPLLVQAGESASRRFRVMATDHLTAAAAERRQRDAAVLASLTSPERRVVSRSLALRGSAPGVSSSSTMIALRPREKQAAWAARDDALEPETLHVTLAYLGETEGDLEPVRAALARVAASHAPLEGEVGGVGSFKDMGDGHPEILLPDVPGLVELRVAVTEALHRSGITYARDHGFTPHLTVDYSEEPTHDHGPVGTPLNFDDIWIVRGDVEQHALPLTGGKPVTAAANLDDPTVKAIREVAAKHADEMAGYGETAWDADERAVLYVCGDWTDPDPIDADYLAIDGVDEARHEAEALPGGWWDAEVVWPDDPPRWVTDPNLSVTAAGKKSDRPAPPWTPPAGDELLDVAGLVDSIKQRTAPVRKAVIETTMKESLGRHSIDWDITNPHTAHVLAQSGSQITHVAETTKKTVNRIINESYEAGLSIDHTAEAITVGMEEASFDRAKLIARTEMVGAVNGGSLAATQIVAGLDGSPFMRKEWLTGHGARHPRHELYVGLNHQTRNLNESFQVGSYDLQYPGDPAGPPHEICNCRCALGYVEGPHQAKQENAPEHTEAAKPAEQKGRRRHSRKPRVEEPAVMGGPDDYAPQSDADMTLLEKQWTPPPKPKGVNVGRGGAGGYTADSAATTLTESGRIGEAAFQRLTGGRILHPEGHGEMSPLDVQWDGMGFEVKSVWTDSSRFAAWPKPYEIEQKMRAAEELGLDPALSIVVMDRETNSALVYYRRGLEGGRLSERTGWKFMGKVPLTESEQESAAVMAAGEDAAVYPMSEDGVRAWDKAGTSHPPFESDQEWMKQFDPVGGFDFAPHATLRIDASLVSSEAGNLDMAYVRDLAAMGDIETAVDVVQMGDRYYVVDGHHRVAARILAGETEVEARVIQGPAVHIEEAANPLAGITDGPATQLLDSEYSEWAKTLTNEQRDSLWAYRTSHGFEQINTRLRTGALHEQHGNEIYLMGTPASSPYFPSVEVLQVDDAIRHIDSAIDLSPAVSEPLGMHVFRGLKDATKAFGEGGPKVGDILDDKAYTSVTTEKDVARRFSSNASYAVRPGQETGEVLIDMELPQGTKGAWMRSVKEGFDRGVGQKGDNFELLLARDTRYRVVSVTKEDRMRTAVGQDGREVTWNDPITNVRMEVIPKSEEAIRPPVVPEPVKTPPVPPPAEELVANPERPFSHWADNTVTSQLARSKKIVREMLAKESLSSRDKALFDRHRQKVADLTAEKQARRAAADRPFAHYTDSSVNSRLSTFRKQLRELDAVASPENAAKRAELRDKVRALEKEREFRKTNRTAQVKPPSEPKPVKPPTPVSPAPEVLPVAEPVELTRMQRLSQSYQSREALSAELRAAGSNPEKLALIEQRVSAAGQDLMDEVEDRMRSRWPQYYQEGSLKRPQLIQQRMVMKEVLSEVRPMGHTPTKRLKYTTPSKTRHSDVASILDGAQDFYPTEWLQAASRTPLRLGTSPRGYFKQNLGGQPNELTINPEENGSLIYGEKGVRNAVHEIGHVMEHEIPDIRRLESAFYRRRCYGERTRAYHGTKSTEPLRRDEFLNEYMGKDYSLEALLELGGRRKVGSARSETMMPGIGDSYELLTMGMESIFAGSNPIWAKDPDMVRFILGLLASL